MRLEALKCHIETLKSQFDEWIEDLEKEVSEKFAEIDKEIDAIKQQRSGVTDAVLSDSLSSISGDEDIPNPGKNRPK
jgi:predicted  nucleic acid-binding Zn-ribbon protein